MVIGAEECPSGTFNYFDGHIDSVRCELSNVIQPNTPVLQHLEHVNIHTLPANMQACHITSKEAIPISN